MNAARGLPHWAGRLARPNPFGWVGFDKRDPEPAILSSITGILAGLLHPSWSDPPCGGLFGSDCSPLNLLGSCADPRQRHIHDHAMSPDTAPGPRCGPESPMPCSHHPGSHRQIPIGRCPPDAPADLCAIAPAVPGERSPGELTACVPPDEPPSAYPLDWTERAEGRPWCFFS